MTSSLSPNHSRPALVTVGVDTHSVVSSYVLWLLQLFTQPTLTLFICLNIASPLKSQWGLLSRFAWWPALAFPMWALGMTYPVMVIPLLSNVFESVDLLTNTFLYYMLYFKKQIQAIGMR